MKSRVGRQVEKGQMANMCQTDEEKMVYYRRTSMNSSSLSTPQDEPFLASDILLKNSVTLKNMVEDADSCPYIPLPQLEKFDINQQVVEYIIEYLRIRDREFKALDEQKREEFLKMKEGPRRSTPPTKWEADYMESLSLFIERDMSNPNARPADKHIEAALYILLVANAFEIQSLMELAAKYFMFRTRNAHTKGEVEFFSMLGCTVPSEEVVQRNKEENPWLYEQPDEWLTS